jgi:hypothetical protein
MRVPLLAGLLIVGLGAGFARSAGLPVEELRSIGGLPAHLAGGFDDISACHLTREGNFVVFDRRAQAVFAAEPGASKPRKIVQIGAEPGRVLRPMAFGSSPDGTFVIADSPAGLARIQFFVYSGSGLGGFTLPGPETPVITLGNTVVSGIASLEYTSPTVLMSLPQNGHLVTEYGSDGRLLRTFGELRRTGQEHDPDVHAALNVGLPLAAPGGGFYYVFVSGVPLFRKYDAAGALVFERHIQGVEVDAFLRTLPTTWARAGGRLPVVPVSVRAAAVDPDGRLWVSLAEPFTYVFDRQGDKIRVVQFRAAGLLAAGSFFFTHDRRVLVTPGCYAFSAD